jgi:hypothetical protein
MIANEPSENPPVAAKQPVAARDRQLIGAAWAVVASCQRVLFTDFGS